MNNYSPITRVKHVLCTSNYFKTLKEKNENHLYFLKDTKEIYKGNTLYSESVEFFNILPENPAKGKLYINSTTLEARIFDGINWKISMPPILDEIHKENNGIVTAKALRDYSESKIKEIIELETKSNTDLVILNQDIEIKTDHSIGNYKDGDIIHKGETLNEILINSLRKRIPPQYEYPTLLLKSINTEVEAGSEITFTIIPEFKKNDGGNIINYNLIRKTESEEMFVIHNANKLAEYSQNNPLFIPEGEKIYFNASLEYNEGNIKVNNLGEESPEGHILNGILEKSISFTGKRNLFYGANNEIKTPEISDDIRKLDSKLLNSYDNDIILQIPISKGDRRITIAYPAEMNDISSIKSYALGLEVKDVFTKNIIQVAGANNYKPIDYKVYTYLSKIPFGNNDMYIINI